MTTRRSKKGSTEEKSSSPRTETFSIAIHAFYCRHGDTILVRFPGPRWMMVDCHLPQGSVREAVFKFFTDNKIDHLDYLFLTHLDTDHYLGMWRVVEYFTSRGRSLGAFGVGGGAGYHRQRVLVRRLSRTEIAVTEFEKLLNALNSYFRKQRGRFIPLNAKTGRIYPATQRYDICLVPVAPDPTVDWLQSDEALGKLSAGEPLDLDLNMVSAACVLAARCERPLLALLPGDLTRDQWDNAMGVWEERQKKDVEWAKRDKGFDVVKIPHHGSMSSHHSALCERVSAGTQVAILSVGSRFPSLPDQRVLSDYINNGFLVFATCRRARRLRYDRVFDLPTKDEPAEHTHHTVTVTIPSRGRISAGPPEAEIQRRQLRLYSAGRD
ncbi:hypothetical protein HQ563_07780 [bacterium]|nr:hypothetical protein [bacterium]